VISKRLLESIASSLPGSCVPGLAAHQPGQDSGRWWREVLPLRNWQWLAKVAGVEGRHRRGPLQHGERQLGGVLSAQVSSVLRSANLESSSAFMAFAAGAPAS
jgi:hypothetical protein